MRTIQVVVEEKLLRAADATAHKRGVNRSALFREALRSYLKQMLTRDVAVAWPPLPDSGSAGALPN
jgi:metal-responsive CopG/Arc/MetJ family transcriptional regulator